jgi:hypothetical protein
MGGQFNGYLPIRRNFNNLFNSHRVNIVYKGVYRPCLY